MTGGANAAKPPREVFDTILLLDFGSQTSHLILRCLRSLNVFCEVLPGPTKAKELNWSPKGIIFSGGKRH
ncbi:putative gmp synthase [Diaporthe ampelina]|uniref:Putative gmp synthase n=1 Tax=Diaporthe ampelina TaxID=1214573 RepID=A0A0G2FA05_9PEZI|nr:putative gmp synthase [Diaporthe ampelina]